MDPRSCKVKFAKFELQMHAAFILRVRWKGGSSGSRRYIYI